MVKKTKVKGWMITIFSIVNFLLYLVVVGLWISIPEETLLNLFTTIASLMITSGLILFNRETFSHFYKSQFFLKMMSSLMTAFLVFVILGFLNFLSFKNPLVWDVTKNQVNSLTDQTENVLTGIEGEVRFKIFSQKKTYPLVYALADLYRLIKPDLKISFVDAELEPQLVREANVTKVPAVEVGYKGRKFLVEDLNELNLTNALIRVTRPSDPTLYFIKGHGELDLTSFENEGGSHLVSLLRAQNYQVRFLNLREKAIIPSDAKAVLLLGSKEGFFPTEVSALKDYLMSGGRAIFALDPDFNGEGVKELKDLLLYLGVKTRNDLVIDQIKHVNGSQGSVPVVHKFHKTHPMSKDFKGDVFFPLAQSLESLDDSWQAIASSNSFPAAWGETSRQEMTSMKLTFSEKEDHKGPLDYVLAKTDKTQRLLVFGNSTFISNTYKKFPKNFMFFLNGINWLVGEERLITLNSPVLEDRPIFMSQNQIGVIFYFTVIFCPLVLVIIAFFMYRRRNRN